MGNPFDFFGEISHPDCKEITAEQFENRTKQSCLSSACLLYFFNLLPLTTGFFIEKASGVAAYGAATNHSLRKTLLLLD